MSDGVAWAKAACTPCLEACKRKLLRNTAPNKGPFPGKSGHSDSRVLSQPAAAGGLSSSPFNSLPAWTPGL